MTRRALQPVTPAALVESRDEAVDTLARTLWGESRGEPLRGIEAVAAVVVNRVAAARARRGHWWGSTVVEVCRKPFQFSCWNDGDPNSAKLRDIPPDHPAFETCLRVARRAVAGTLPDPTDGATHYHARSVHPSWAMGRLPCAEIGGHLFYKDIP
ncbi:MAG TPA: cell wall hydrolase [Azospirillaceae bacterium]|nr:cell wall hydrolase [Azospirillaceae bacterium]